MSHKLLSVLVVLSLAVGVGCGDNSEEPNDNANSGQNAGANNGENNATNNGENNATNNGENNAANNGENNATNNGENNAANNGENNAANNGENNATNNFPGGDPQCNGGFGQANACGGELTGSYVLNDVCTDFDIQASLQQLCPTATATGFSIDAEGTLTFAGNVVSREVSGSMSSQVQIPSLCANLVGGCAGIQAAIINNVDNSMAFCEDTQTGCTCLVSVAIDGDAQLGTFTTDGGVLTTGTGRTFYYCVEADTLSIREFGQGASESGFVQFYAR
jgi:hypothetical protein